MSARLEVVFEGVCDGDNIGGDRAVLLNTWPWPRVELTFAGEGDSKWFLLQEPMPPLWVARFSVSRTRAALFRKLLPLLFGGVMVAAFAGDGE